MRAFSLGYSARQVCCGTAKGTAWQMKTLPCRLFAASGGVTKTSKPHSEQTTSGESLMSQIQPDDDASLLREFKERCAPLNCGLCARRTPNRSTVLQHRAPLAQRQEGATWVKGVVQQLAADLRAEFPGLGVFLNEPMAYAPVLHPWRRRWPPCRANCKRDLLKAVCSKQDLVVSQP